MYHIQLSLNVARLQALSMAKSKYMTNPISTISKEILSLEMEAIVLRTFFDRRLRCFFSMEMSQTRDYQSMIEGNMVFTQYHRWSMTTRS